MSSRGLVPSHWKVCCTISRAPIGRICPIRKSLCMARFNFWFVSVATGPKPRISSVVGITLFSLSCGFLKPQSHLAHCLLHFPEPPWTDIGPYPDHHILFDGILPPRRRCWSLNALKCFSS